MFRPTPLVLLASLLAGCQPSPTSAASYVPFDNLVAPVPCGAPTVHFGPEQAGGVGISDVVRADGVGDLCVVDIAADVMPAEALEAGRPATRFLLSISNNDDQEHSTGVAAQAVVVSVTTADEKVRSEILLTQPFSPTLAPHTTETRAYYVARPLSDATEVMAWIHMAFFTGEPPA